MSIFSDNLRYLREMRKKSQQQTAESLEIKRGRYEPYESGKVEPPYEMLKRIARHYGISIDLLLSVDVRKYRIEELLTLDDNRIVLPIMVDAQGDNLVEIVTHKAKAGYAAGGYADVGFISELDHIRLPWLNRNEKYRTFPIDGDSMPPHNDQSYIIGKYVERLSDITDGKTYVVVTKNREMVYKRVSRKGRALVLASDNRFYAPYEIPVSEVAEIWEYAGSLERSGFTPETPDAGRLEDVIRKLQADVAALAGRS
jgi:transcriptional regulator with XRE-family HTH domain